MLSRATEIELADLISRTWWDPFLFAKIAFPWRQPGTFLADYDGPDEFQTGVLVQIGTQLRAISAGTAPSNTIRIAVSSGHGVGKSALMAMIELWWQSTRPHSKSITTAGTQVQLTTKTWRELEKWRQVCITGHWFKWTATSLKCIRAPVTWAAEATPWSATNAQAFAGTHEQWVMYKMDEASTIADSIWETSEGAFTTEGPHIWLAFGNPEQPTGRFRECWTKHRDRWITLEVDSRNSRFANKKLLQEWIDTYGIDSDFVRVRILGKPPKTPPEQFISTELWETASGRWNEAEKQEKDIPRGIPLIMGVDPGAGGQGKTTIVFRRGGFVYKNILRSSEADQVKVAGIIAQAIRDYKPLIVFIDAHGIGWGVYNILQTLGFRNVIACFAGDTKGVSETLVYYNMRVEWWSRVREWMKTGALPDDSILREDLLAPKRYFNLGNRMLLESKDDMKARGIPSPDCFVAGTLVETPIGHAPIETLQPGDAVVTPFGVTTVLRVWEHLTTELTTATFSNGSCLRATGKHKIFAWDHGEIRLDALSLTTEVDTSTHARKFRWRLAWLCFIWVKGFGFKKAVDIIVQGGRVRWRDFCIVGCGATITALSQRVWRFITWTKTGATLGCQTWNCARLVPTSESTCSNASLGTQLGSASSCGWPESEPQSGMVHQKGWRGTPSSASGLGRGEGGSHPHALSVSPSSTHSSLAARSIAALPASGRSLLGAISLALEAARGAVRSSLRIVIGRRPVVPVSVQTESVPPTRVYNLTLAEHNAYYANGILSFNSGDALALTFAYPVPTAIEMLGIEELFADGQPLEPEIP